MIIGAQKAGTSSLYHYLSQHPKISGSNPKEVGYFHRDRHFGKTITDYRTSFRGLRSRSHFEATPAYLYHPNVAPAIYYSYPSMKFIVVLREPGKRAYSAWNHYRNLFESGRYKKAVLEKPTLPGNELASKLFENRTKFPSFRECIDIELEIINSDTEFEPGILRRGLYLKQLEEYWKYFSKDQFLVLGFKDLTDNLEASLKKITDFLGVQSFDIDSVANEARNQRTYTEPMLPEDRNFLDNFYETPNKKLFDAIGRLNW
ncbi:sulfotransferase family protein [Halovibrio salipaludis]|nr:sulfotransferase domain-containing protein [Halovibrio salipaludis]